MALTLDGVSAATGGEVFIHPTDLTLERGTMNVLLGPTLAGKTSLMRLMAGLDRPTTGRILWDGVDVTGMRVQARKVAMVYQQFINYPSMTVRENIASPLKLQGLNRAEIDKRVRAAAEMVKLDEDKLNRKPLELSGGQQQRCARNCAKRFRGSSSSRARSSSTPRQSRMRRCCSAAPPLACGRGG
jgi:glycerol transport system ATP-binding protein